MASLMATLLQPPPTAEEISLKEQVTQALTSQGVIAKLKAELRAAVFQVMHEREGVLENNACGSKSPRLSDFPGQTGATALALIIECLQFFKWEHALRVLLAEANAEGKSDSSLLAKALGGRISKEMPVLFQLIEDRQLGEDLSTAPVHPVAIARRDHVEAREEQRFVVASSIGAKTLHHEAEVHSSVVQKLEDSERESKYDDGESSAEIEESMAEEVLSGSELEESTFTTGGRGDDDEEEATPYHGATDDKQEEFETSKGKQPVTGSTTNKTLEHEEEHSPDAQKLEDSERESKYDDVVEESMAEEIPSGSELEESTYTNGDMDEEATPLRGNEEIKTSVLFSTQRESKKEEDELSQGDDSQEDEDIVALAAPPPAPARLPSLPPIVGAPSNGLAGDEEDDFDAELEADRLRKLDAALQAMEAEDDTGTLQQLKASLQVELQEQESFMSNEDAGSIQEKTSTTQLSGHGDEHEDDDDEGYGSSDFEEEEEIASDISEEMESMPELSDKEDESEDGAAASQAEVHIPRVLQTDKPVDSEDALNSYDYIEAVETSKW